MQQFFCFIVFCACVAAPLAAEPLTSNVISCGSKASVGEIDLAAPPKPAPKKAEAERANQAIAFIPIETALNGSLNAPTAYHGAVAVALPKPGGADYSGDCGPVHTKPVAADTPAP